MLRTRCSELPEQRGRAEGMPISQKFSGAHVCPVTLFPHPLGTGIPVLRVPPKQVKRVERGGSEAGGRVPEHAEGSAAFGWGSARCVICKDRQLRSPRGRRGAGEPGGVRHELISLQDEKHTKELRESSIFGVHECIY